MAFDYAQAWREVAAPAYQTLPPEIHSLISRVQAEAADLHQLPDTTMPWPTYRVLSDEDAALARPGANTSLRAAFMEVDSATLAYASRVVYYAGHWCPTLSDAGVHEGVSVTVRLSGVWSGVYWKFSHYADQILRERVLTAPRGIKVISGWTREIHEGVLRLGYSSHYMSTWVEVCPAYPEAIDAAREEITKLTNSVFGIFRRGFIRDEAAYQAVENLRERGGVWPTPEWAAIMNTKQFAEVD